MIGSSLVSIFSSFVLYEILVPSILNLNLYFVTFWSIKSIHVILLCPSLNWTKKFPLHTHTHPTNIYLRIFCHALSSFAFDQNFRFNYGYQCNNQFVWCAINQNKEYKQSKVQKEINEDKSIQWTTKPMHINRSKKTVFVRYNSLDWCDCVYFARKLTAFSMQNTHCIFSFYKSIDLLDQRLPTIFHWNQ